MVKVANSTNKFLTKLDKGGELKDTFIDKHKHVPGYEACASYITLFCDQAEVPHPRLNSNQIWVCKRQ